MRNLRFVLVLLAFLSIPLQRADAVDGRVWLDANGNGHIDAEEQGVAGCLVSDGFKLVRTDANGRYTLEPGSERTSVFVINPPGTWPSGPWWKFVDKATSSGSLDFALQEQPQDGPLYFAQGTDIHLRPDAVSLYRQYIEHINNLNLPLKFVVHTGDLVVDALARDEDAAETLFQLYEDETKAIRYPIRDVPGNHEHVAIARKGTADHGADYGTGMYVRRLGPLSYAFRYGPYHFLALDGTTLDPAGNNGYRDRLDDASVAWAARYLETVAANEPVVVMVHQPLGNRDTDGVLLEALEGKRLMAVLCGHGHGRSVTKWDGAPMIMGGAVSHAWHGFVPYPPDPWGFVVYRLDGEQLEHAFLDWDAERSVDLKSPAWRALATKPELAVTGTISDFDGSVDRVVCRLADRQADADVTRTGHLVDQIEATLDISGLDEGVYDLSIEAAGDPKSACHVRPVIVKNGQTAPAGPTNGPTRLKFRVAGDSADNIQLRLNGQPLPMDDAEKTPSREWSLDLPNDRLQRLNQITIVPEHQGEIQVSRVRIERDDRTFVDIRFAPSMRQTTKPGQNSPGLDYYIDLTYSGPRGLSQPK